LWDKDEKMMMKKYKEYVHFFEDEEQWELSKMMKTG
jgi:hypothetical protein